MQRVASLTVTLLALVALGCRPTDSSSAPQTSGEFASIEEVEQGLSGPADYGDVFDWDNHGALDFLEFLRGESGFYTVWGIHPAWVKEDDLPELMELLDSTEPCANVKSALSSYIDVESSTVGNEAAYLIEGYRTGRYPPRLNSTRPRPDKREIREWWREKRGT
jgi:hypothetical protein